MKMIEKTGFFFFLLLSAALTAQTRQTPPEFSAKTHQQHTMMLLGKVDLGGSIFTTNANDIIFAFIDGECRGKANPMTEHNGLIFLSIAENTEQQKPITFMVWLDDRQELLPLNETLTFEPLAAVGNMDNPFILTLGEMVGVNEADGGIWIGEPYPNPFEDKTILPVRLTVAARINWIIYNNVGQKIRTGIEHKHDAGLSYILIDRAAMVPGVYVLQIIIRNADQNLQKQVRLIVK